MQVAQRAQHTVAHLSISVAKIVQTGEKYKSCSNIFRRKEITIIVCNNIARVITTSKYNVQLL